MDRKIASERLRALAANDEKRSTASRLLDLIDDIEAALAAGVPRCSGLQSKLAGTAISGFLGPH